ncbi:hypothetical protein E5163_04130 [Marinicauda algicola]|uniref:DUF5681 domain-containing protein n=1 Tax=Marinicauda algicola TaxID=2029849 RepID=A0A4S2H4U1_9PROT|nr:DUF5681 domain-containing protein [Marinicauda algicola]TGY90322.1 hypothetical protein E5163_04130 [Marinicauda algicola]
MSDKPLQVRHRTRKAKPGSVSAPIASSAGHDPHRPVGYGNPPRATQFQKGKSGNPKGRPRLKKNLGTLIDEVLFKEVVITEGGRRRKVSAAKALFMRQLSEGLSGDGKAFERLFRAHQMLSGSAAEGVDGASTEPTDAEKAMVAELKRWLEAGQAGKGEAGDD